MPLWVEFWDRPFFPESVSDKIKQNHGQSYTIIDASEWVCFRPPNPDLKWSIYRVRNTTDCPPPVCTFLCRFFAYFPIENYRFSYHSNVLLVFRENIKYLALFGTRTAVGSFMEGDSPLKHAVLGNHFWLGVTSPNLQKRAFSGGYSSSYIKFSISGARAGRGSAAGRGEIPHRSPKTRNLIWTLARGL